MVVVQSFTYITKDGNKKIEFHEWAKQSLTSNEYAKWTEAVQRQSAYRQDAIDAGKLIHDKIRDVYIWDEEWINGKDPTEFKEYDIEWLEFWERYLDETGTQLEIELEKE